MELTRTDNGSEFRVIFYGLQKVMIGSIFIKKLLLKMGTHIGRVKRYHTVISI